MRNRLVAALTVLFLAVCGILVVRAYRHNVGKVSFSSDQASGKQSVLSAAPSGQSGNTISASVICPKPQDRLKMGLPDRLALLERLGCIPEDGDLSDYSIAQKASWWGHRLDPVSFWSNRVVWLDDRSLADAYRHGRRFPPIPHGDLRLVDRDDTRDVPSCLASAEGPSIQYQMTDRENAYWNTFGAVHPRPPEDLERGQRDLAERVLKALFAFEHGGNSAGLTSTELADMIGHWRQEAADSGYPAEALTDEALRLTYLVQVRADYQNALAAQAVGNTLPMRRLERRLYVPLEEVKQPAGNADQGALAAWKTTYLRRLRAQRVDESYIIAYMKAWNLNPKLVFTEQ